MFTHLRAETAQFYLVWICAPTLCFLGCCLLPQFPAASLTVCCSGPCSQLHREEETKDRELFSNPPPSTPPPQHTQPYRPTSTTTSSSTTTFFHRLLMFCKESPSTLAPSLQLSPWPQCPAPTLYPDVRRIVKGRKVGAPGSALLHPQPQTHHPS